MFLLGEILATMQGNRDRFTKDVLNACTEPDHVVTVEPWSRNHGEFLELAVLKEPDERVIVGGMIVVRHESTLPQSLSTYTTSKSENVLVDFDFTLGMSV